MLFSIYSLLPLRWMKMNIKRSSPEREHPYTQSLRQRSHNFQLPDRTSVLRDKNFIMRMLYCDALYWQFCF